MATNPLPSVGFTLTIPDTTTLVSVDGVAFGASAIPVPDNCRSIVVYNMDASNRVFLKFDTTAAANIARMVIGSCTVLPTSSSITFAVGYLGDRQSLSLSGDANLYLAAESGTNVLVNITFMQGRGSSLP